MHLKLSSEMCHIPRHLDLLLAGYWSHGFCSEIYQLHWALHVVDCPHYFSTMATTNVNNVPHISSLLKSENYLLFVVLDVILCRGLCIDRIVLADSGSTDGSQVQKSRQLMNQLVDSQHKCVEHFHEHV